MRHLRLIKDSSLPLKLYIVLKTDKKDFHGGLGGDCRDGGVISTATVGTKSRLDFSRSVYAHKPWGLRNMSVSVCLFVLFSVLGTEPRPCAG